VNSTCISNLRFIKNSYETFKEMFKTRETIGVNATKGDAMLKAYAIQLFDGTKTEVSGECGHDLSNDNLSRLYRSFHPELSLRSDHELADRLEACFQFAWKVTGRIDLLDVVERLFLNEELVF